MKELIVDKNNHLVKAIDKHGKQVDHKATIYTDKEFSRIRKVNEILSYRSFDIDKLI